jgi:cyanophycinase-like exopeptidase
MTSGTIALIGSGEFLPPIQPLDQQLSEHIQGTPHVVVLPTASAPDGPGVPERWARMGVEHFGLLNIAAEPVMVLTREDAQKPELVEHITHANWVYFSGGKPRYLLETLRGTLVWEAVTQVYQNGGVIAGCSAGAMVMGSALFDFPKFWHTLPALALAPGLIIIPHFDEIPKAIFSTLKPPSGKMTVVGIEGSTALVSHQERWTVYGKGGVTVFERKKTVRYTQGEQVELPSTDPLPSE